MKADGIWNNIFRRKKKSKADVLAKCHIFKELPRGDLEKLAKLSFQRNFNTGDIIFKEDDPGVGLYVIDSGEVEIYNNNDQTIDTFSDKDFFGEISLVEDGKRTANARATKKSRLLFLSGEEFTKFIYLNNTSGVRILLVLTKILATRLKYSNSLLEKVTLQDDAK